MFLSCFEVRANKIKDLLADPGKVVDEGDISNFYAPNLQTAIKVLTQGIRFATVFTFSPIFS